LPLICHKSTCELHCVGVAVRSAQKVKGAVCHGPFVGIRPID